MRPLALALVLVAVSVLPAQGQDHPRLGFYSYSTGNGWPFVNDRGGDGYPQGPPNHGMLDSLARYHQIIVPASPFTEYRTATDALDALRARRPDIELIAYVWGQNIWEAQQRDSTVHLPTRYRRLVDGLSARLYNKQGGYHSLGPINFAKRTNGRYVMAEAAADFYYDAVVRSGTWDGIFIDVLCSSIGWTQTPAESIDFVRAGYPTFAAFDAAWGAAVDTLGDRLRRLAGPDFKIMGNCGRGTNYNAFNGWMRENFPFQNGDWYSNMFADPGGYLAGDLRFLAPHNDLISTIPQELPGNPYTSWNLRRVRFGLGSAALGDGYAVFNDGSPGAHGWGYFTWWYDEYAVNTTTGISSGQLQHTGWLGQPLGSWYQMIWVGTQPDAVTNPNFETNVSSGWTFAGTTGSSMVRDASTAAVGNASAKIHVATSSPYAYFVNCRTVGTIPMTQGQVYSATFWAKASAPRPITVSAAITAGSLASQVVNLETGWKQYQIALRANASNNAGLMFQCAAAVGDVWIDDVHLQAGATTIYRRDFQNGVVLVNPSGGALTVPLERDFRRILGTVDPLVNNGTLVTSVTVPASDALFLIGDDRIPPATILDLQPFIHAEAVPRDPRSSSPPRHP